MAGDMGIALLGLALVYMLSKKNGVPPANGFISTRRVKRFVREPEWRIPTREFPEADLETQEDLVPKVVPRTYIAPTRPRPAIATYVSPRRPGVTLKKFVREPEWRIPTRGLVIGAETLGRGEG